MRWRTSLSPRDAAAVGRLVADTGFFSDQERDVAIELVDEALARGKASGYRFIFAETADEPRQLAGYVCFGPIPATASSYDLYWIVVAPGMQNRGIGARLMQRAEAAAAGQGATRMFVDTSGRAQYAPTRAFYESRGYTVEATLRDFYASGDDKVIYAKSIKAPH